MNIAFISETTTDYTHLLKIIRENGAVQHLNVKFFRKEKDLENFTKEDFAGNFDFIITNIAENGLRRFWEEDEIINDSLNITLCRNFVFINFMPQEIENIDVIYAKILRAMALLKKYLQIAVPRMVVLCEENNAKAKELVVKLVDATIPTFITKNTELKGLFFGNKFDAFINISNEENFALQYFNGIKVKIELEGISPLIEPAVIVEDEQQYFYDTLYLANDMLKNASGFAEFTKNPLKFSLKRENTEFKAF